MRLRRCTVLYLEPREEAAFDLASLLAGGNGLRRTRRWLALAPHLEMEVEVDADERELLGLLGPGEWTERDGFDAGWQPAIGRLLSEGLLIGDEIRSGLAEPGPAPLLIGEPALCARYARAFARFGIAGAEIIPDAAVAGLWRIAATAGATSTCGARAPGCRPAAASS